MSQNVNVQFYLIQLLVTLYYGIVNLLLLFFNEMRIHTACSYTEKI